MLKINAPTTIPIMRMTSGSKMAVNRLIEARVSFFVNIRHPGEHQIQFAGFLPDRQQMRSQRRKHLRPRQRLRNPFTPLDPLGNVFQRIRHPAVVQNPADILKRLHQRHSCCPRGSPSPARTAMFRLCASASPSIGIFRRLSSHQRRPAGVLHVKTETYVMPPARRCSATSHHQSCTT